MAKVKKETGRKKEHTAIDKQRGNNGGIKGRAGDGRFVKGHKLGFQAGVSGNPQGRPRSRSFSEACRSILREPCPEDLEGRTYADVIAEKLCQLAVKGDIRAARELADRAEGRPKSMNEEQGTITLENARELLQQLRETQGDYTSTKN
jgi:hypothetical protein